MLLTACGERCRLSYYMFVSAEIATKFCVISFAVVMIYAVD